MRERRQISNHRTIHACQLAVRFLALIAAVSFWFLPIVTLMTIALSSSGNISATGAVTLSGLGLLKLLCTDTQGPLITLVTQLIVVTLGATGTLLARRSIIQLLFCFAMFAGFVWWMETDYVVLRAQSRLFGFGFLIAIGAVFCSILVAAILVFQESRRQPGGTDSPSQ